ncbi:MAG: dihydroorotase [Treponema sp.]|nr:MAG: dihydroorotase [Treponema sp.]
MIDPHVHLRDWEQSEKETIEHGITLAFDAGFSAFFDMPNTKPTLTNSDSLARRLEFGQKIARQIDSSIFYGVYAGITADKKQIEDIVDFHSKHFPNCVGFKMFAGHSTGNMGITSDEAQRQVYRKLAELDYTGVVAVHCEKEELLCHEAWNPAVPESHSIARPEIAEVKSIEDQIEFSRSCGFKGHLHICHISTKEGIDLVVQAKQSGLKISCGATAHHALLDTSAYSRFGIFAKMNPPLRNPKNKEAVFLSLINGKIDLVESDHAPHTAEDKKNGASGVPGFAGSLMLLQKLRSEGCSEARLKELFGKAVNRIWNMNLTVRLPSNEKIAECLPKLKAGYPYNVFE